MVWLSNPFVVMASSWQGLTFPGREPGKPGRDFVMYAIMFSGTALQSFGRRMEDSQQRAPGRLASRGKLLAAVSRSPHGTAADRITIALGFAPNIIGMAIAAALMSRGQCHRPVLPINNSATTLTTSAENQCRGRPLMFW